jgi:hypothetical protein
MTVREVLGERQDAVLVRWRELIRASDSRAVTSLPARGSDPFHDPVGAALLKGTAAILEAMWGEGEPEAVRPGLDEIVRVRSVQTLTASQALGFVFLLRRALHEIAGDVLDAGEWPRLDARLDAISLQAFEIYVACREKVFEIRAREAARANSVLLRRARLLGDGRSGPDEARPAAAAADDSPR